MNIAANLNPRHSEIGNLKVNRDGSLWLHLFALHTGQLKVGPHGVFLAPLQRTEQVKQLLQLHVERISVYKAVQIKLFIQFDEFCSQVSYSKVIRRKYKSGPTQQGESDSNLWDLASYLHIKNTKTSGLLFFVAENETWWQWTKLWVISRLQIWILMPNLRSANTN